MGSHKLTGLAAGTANGHSVRYNEFNGLYKDLNGTLASTGSSNAYAVTSNSTYSSYAAGMVILFIANHTNTAACTLNVNTLGAKAIKDAQGNEVMPGVISNGQPVIVEYDATNGYFRGVNISPTPSVTGPVNLYVSTAGSDSNAGTSVGSPFLTVQKAFDFIAASRIHSVQGWTINLAAGTYTENVNVDSDDMMSVPIYITGPDVTHPTVPTAIIAASSTSSPALSLSNTGHYILTDVKVSGATTSIGIKINSAAVTLTNVHISGCLIGVSSQNFSKVVAVGGIWTGRGSGVADGIGYQGLFNEVHDLGGTSAVNATQITAYERGILMDEGSQGHLDWCQVTNCVTGLNVKRGAGAANTDNMTISGCTNGVLVENSGWYSNSVTYSSNTYNVVKAGSAPELTYLTGTNEAKTLRQVESTNIANHTGTASKTLLWTSATIPDWGFSKSGDTNHVRVFGSCSLASGTCVVAMELYNGTTSTEVGTITVPSGATKFCVEFDCSYLGNNDFRTFSRGTFNSGTNTIDYQEDTQTVKDLTNTIRVYATLGNSGDSIKFGKLILSNTIGG